MKGYNEFPLERKNLQFIPRNLIGIYGIKNNAVNKIYVGASVNIYRRVGTHLGNLIWSKHPVKALQRDYIDQQRARFSFVILETFRRMDYTYKELQEKLAEQELFWINQFPQEQRYNKSKIRVRSKTKGRYTFEITKDLLVLFERDYALHKGKPNLQLLDLKRIFDSNTVRNVVDFYNFIAEYAIKNKWIIAEEIIDNQRYYYFEHYSDEE